MVVSIPRAQRQTNLVVGPGTSINVAIAQGFDPVHDVGVCVVEKVHDGPTGNDSCRGDYYMRLAAGGPPSHRKGVAGCERASRPGSPVKVAGNANEIRGF